MSIELISAGVGSAVTLIGVAVAFLQWRRTTRREARAEYVKRRRETLSQIWDLLAEIESAHRRDLPVNTPGLIELLEERSRSVSLLLLRSAPFLLADEQEWAEAVMRSIVQIDLTMRRERAEGSSRSIKWCRSYDMGDLNRSGRRGVLERWRPVLSHDPLVRLQDAKTALGSRYADVVASKHK